MKKNIYEDDLVDSYLFNILESKKYNDEEKNAMLKQIASEKNIVLHQLYQRYSWLKQMDINPNIIHLKENHELIYEIFDECNKMLNNNQIEYYYTSGILSYLLVSKELERYHHDLDIFVNMNDLEKLEQECKKYNFLFERKVGNRSDKTKRIMLKLYYKENIDLPITIFMYTREKDASIIQKDYYFTEDGNRFVEYIYNSPAIVELSFSNEIYYHNQIKYFAITLEALYLSKVGNRSKDIYDCNVFQEFVDITKLNKLKQAFINNKSPDTIRALEDVYYEYIFSNAQKMKVLKND